jgi:hypothetical protein
VGEVRLAQLPDLQPWAALRLMLGMPPDDVFGPLDEPGEVVPL